MGVNTRKLMFILAVVVTALAAHVTVAKIPPLLVAWAIAAAVICWAWLAALCVRDIHAKFDEIKIATAESPRETERMRYSFSDDMALLRAEVHLDKCDGGCTRQVFGALDLRKSEHHS